MTTPTEYARFLLTAMNMMLCPEQGKPAEHTTLEEVCLALGDTTTANNEIALCFNRMLASIDWEALRPRVMASGTHFERNDVSRLRMDLVLTFCQTLDEHMRSTD